MRGSRLIPQAQPLAQIECRCGSRRNPRPRRAETFFLARAIAATQIAFRHPSALTPSRSGPTPDRLRACPLLQLFSFLGPVDLHGQCRYAGRREGVCESTALLETLFKVRQGESRVDGKKCSLWIGGLQKSATLPAVSPGSITQDFQQGFRFLACRNMNDTVGACQSLQFSRLLHIAGQENKKFLARPPLIAQYKYVASQQRHNFFSRDLLADPRHA